MGDGVGDGVGVCGAETHEFCPEEEGLQSPPRPSGTGERFCGIDSYWRMMSLVEFGWLLIAI